MEVELRVKADLLKYWVIRIIKDDKKKKEVIQEYKCFCDPNEEIIAQALWNHRNDGKVFAVVEEIYKLVEG